LQCLSAGDENGRFKVVAPACAVRRQPGEQGDDEMANGPSLIRDQDSRIDFANCSNNHLYSTPQSLNELQCDCMSKTGAALEAGSCQH
ncbi:hypothetical protein EJB05_26084, partial [Eragrostis curvula]